MCGIIGVLSRRTSRTTPTAKEVLALLDSALEAGAKNDIDRLAATVTAVDKLLRGDPGQFCLADNHQLVASMTSRIDQLDSIVAAYEVSLEKSAGPLSETSEHALEEITRAKDAIWELRNDRIRTAKLVDALAGQGASASARSGYFSIQQAFSGLDRLEVRGRDSAGVHVLVSNHGLKATDKEVVALLAGRGDDALFMSGAVRMTENAWSFVYKAAAEIGELGDNTRVMRNAVMADDLLRLCISQPDSQVAVLAHTRWASVGIISEPNAHPVNSEELEGKYDDAYLVAALNGDVDNHADLRVEHGLRVAGPITTDAKVIPALVSRRLAVNPDLSDAFRETVSQFEGSVAIAAASATEPTKLLLALHGSGQGLCIGLAEDRFVVASEPYGVVEETMDYVRMDGESLAEPDNQSSRGQVAVLSAENAGELGGIRLRSYDGREISLREENVSRAEITTRDINRGEHKHFLAKEIAEAPESFRKTLRGRIVEVDGVLTTELSEKILPKSICSRLASGKIKKVRVIGQGTAAVAGQALAKLLQELVGIDLSIEAQLASELSGFGLELDMSDTIVVAVSQSGTTTDTNRTVDLARSRGASVLAIVNRRGSELSEKADGVMYTSDGRDVEMSVASTKAFYAQVAAGVLYACALSKAMNKSSDKARHALLAGLRRIPDALGEVLETRPQIAAAARQFASSRRYWTVVGNGMNTIAAQEVRIKLSELCYKSISSDSTEDKKHIDLSCEPLIFVCATGLLEGTASDVAKEIAIYRAHKALPIVVANAGQTRFDAAAALLLVPNVESSLSFILSVMVGHLFGYEAALAIDALARPLREAREVVEHAVERGGDANKLLAKIRTDLGVPATRFTDALATGNYDGNLEASTAVRIVTMLRDTLSNDPVQAYQRSSGKIASPELLLDDLTSALTRGIDELTRPVDAIKHQAKTVTVGISRSDEGLFDRKLVKSLLEAGVARERLSYRVLKIVADLDAAVSAVTGFTRYQIDGDIQGSTATIAIVDRGGMSKNLTSRVERNSHLVGTKRRVASDQEVLVARGRSDNRTVIMVPETKSGQTTGITLLHVMFHERLPVTAMRAVLQGYDRRFDRLVDWVTETEGSFREDRLAEVSVADLLILPISEMADLWRTGK
ncbi:MAG: SIS domain-containing protein [Actinobacteria bacterium]|nr:SIS domain-containing protein [Actinomycetota bacterium]